MMSEESACVRGVEVRLAFDVVSIALASPATFPINRWLISRDQGHALVQAFQAPAAAPTHSKRHHQQA